MKDRLLEVIEASQLEKFSRVLVEQLRQSRLWILKRVEKLSLKDGFRSSQEKLSSEKPHNQAGKVDGHPGKLPSRT